MSFNGPWSKDLATFKKAIQSIPSQYKSSFNAMSNETLEKICNPGALHIWETDSDIDNLLQLTAVIARLCNLGLRKQARTTGVGDARMVIIAEEKQGRNNSARVCELVRYLIGVDGKKHLEGTAYAFGGVVVVRGWNNGERSEGKEMGSVIKRINVAIERVLKMKVGDYGKTKVVWHHGPVVHFLLHWINNTTSTLRSSLSAITIAGALDLTVGLAPSNLGRQNQLPDMQRLEEYAKRLDIPVTFVDSTTQLITFDYLATYMYYHAYYINTFLPPSLLRPHLHKAQDELITFVFQLRGAGQGVYGSEVVRMVQSQLTPSKAKQWAQKCINADNYTKSACRAAAQDNNIHHAVQLADSPFALFSHGHKLPAFARLAVGPASVAAEQRDYSVCAPVHLNFKTSQFRPGNPSPFRILVPAAAQDEEKATHRVQGLMMGVLERVRQEKGMPVLGGEQKGVWEEVVRACLWALEGCKGKCPKGVEEKVAFVTEKLRKGTWRYVVEAEGQAQVGGAAGYQGVGMNMGQGGFAQQQPVSGGWGGM